jgi:ATP-dependent exoDNAse (exonuclease V) beta subunit
MGIARQEMDAVERAGITGRKLLWEVVRNEIMDDLDKFLEKDNRKRAELGISPVAVERKFGFSQGQPPVELKLADSKKISFKGVIDRIDTGANMVMVIDYKTGSSKNYPSKKQDPLTAAPVCSCRFMPWRPKICIRMKEKQEQLTGLFLRR